MAHVADHLSIVELEERYRSCTDACSARHFQTIWLLAQGHTIEEAAETTCFVPRWIEELLARYNAVGPQALGDLRRNNGAPPSVLKAELLAKLRVRLNEPPPDPAILILIFRVVGGADEAILVRQVESGNGLRIELEVGS